MKLDFYEPADLAKIVKRSFSILGCSTISDDAIMAIALRSRGTPRIANRYTKILRDYATIGKSIESRVECEAIFESF
jgi:holliday junction DNA helicase RuvB